MGKISQPPLFTYAEEWHNNACINGFHPENWAYSEGYRQAAELLIAHVDAIGSEEDARRETVSYVAFDKVRLLSPGKLVVEADPANGSPVDMQCAQEAPGDPSAAWIFKKSGPD